MATVPKTYRTSETTVASASAGPYPLGFRLFDDDGISVYVNGVPRTDFTLTSSYLNGYDDSAEITFTSSLATNDVLRIDSALKPWREEDLINGDQNLVQKMNVELARLWSAVADTNRNTLRAVRGFDLIDPIDGVDLTEIAQAEAYATAAAASAAAAAVSEAAALAAENSLLEWKGAWANATNYAPSDIVHHLGSAYICVSAHTSTTLSNPSAPGAAGKWELFVLQGSPGAGTGDVVAANNGSEYTPTADTFRSNLGLAIGTNIQAYHAALAQIAGVSWAQGDIMFRDGSQLNRLAKGTAGQFLKMNAGATAPEWAAAPTLTLATKQSASGTEVDFTGIPAGTKEIIVMFDGASLDGTNHFLVQLGDAGGFEVSGYTSASAGGGASASSTAGFIVIGNSAAAGIYGQMSLNLMDASTFTWVAQHGVSRSGISMSGGGTKSLSAELTQIRITSTGGNSFDAGSINVAYR